MSTAPAGLLPELLSAMFAGTLLLHTFHPVPHLIAAEFDLPVPVVALPLTVDTLASIMAAPVIAPVPDRIGRRGTLVTSMALGSGDWALIASTPISAHWPLDSLFSGSSGASLSRCSSALLPTSSRIRGGMCGWRHRSP